MIDNVFYEIAAEGRNLNIASSPQVVRIQKDGPIVNMNNIKINVQGYDRDTNAKIGTNEGNIGT